MSSSRLKIELQPESFLQKNTSYEFPTGPPAIGNQIPIKPEQFFKVRDVNILMFSPTQCVTYRLAAWFHWDDRRSLIHAIWVCEKHPVSLKKIKRWATQENVSDKFEQFFEQYKKLKPKVSKKSSI